MEKRLQWYRGYRSCSWRVDETYVKVKGQLSIWTQGDGVAGEIHLINRVFDVYSF